jgi:hypothetical protein
MAPYIGTLAVQEPLRSCGWGTSLLERAEQHALDRGCTNAWLCTFSFQARPFYERHGYAIFGALDNYPPTPPSCGFMAPMKIFWPRLRTTISSGCEHTRLVDGSSQHCAWTKKPARRAARIAFG